MTEDCGGAAVRRNCRGINSLFAALAAAAAKWPPRHDVTADYSTSGYFVARQQ